MHRLRSFRILTDLLLGAFTSQIRRQNNICSSSCPASQKYINCLSLKKRHTHEGCSAATLVVGVSGTGCCPDDEALALTDPEAACCIATVRALESAPTLIVTFESDVGGLDMAGNILMA